MDIFQTSEIDIEDLNSIYCPYNQNFVLDPFPVGGILSGPGINGTFFNPFLAGPDSNHTISYELEGACGDTIERTTYVLPFTDLQLTGFDATLFCKNDTTIPLFVNYFGGTLSGSGVSITTQGNTVFNSGLVFNNSVIQFDPSAAGKKFKSYLFG